MDLFTPALRASSFALSHGFGTGHDHGSFFSLVHIEASPVSWIFFSAPICGSIGDVVLDLLDNSCV